MCVLFFFFFFQAEDGIRDYKVTGVQTCALPIFHRWQIRVRSAPGLYGFRSPKAQLTGPKRAPSVSGAVMAVNEQAAPLSEDEQKLHQMGYAQELRRRMSGFSNFAVSFTIISILSGCL